MRIIATGFEPFENRKLNQSSELVRQLHLQSQFSIETLVLPVEWEACFEPLDSKLNALKEPALVLCFGEASRSVLNFECVGLNRRHSKSPDNMGKFKCNEPIISSGPLALETSWDLARLQSSYLETQTSLELSFSAGTYICNEVLYRCLNYKGAPIAPAFIHCPIETHSLSLTKQVQSIELMIQFLKENPDVCFRS